MVRHSSPRPGQPSVAVNPAVCRTGHMEIQTTLCYRLCGENGMELRGISSVQGGENSAEAMKVAADTIQGETLTGLSGQRRFSYSVVKKGGVQTARPQVGLAVLPAGPRTAGEGRQPNTAWPHRRVFHRQPFGRGENRGTLSEYYDEWSDGAGCHSSDDVQKLLAQSFGKNFFASGRGGKKFGSGYDWPPYSPDLTPLGIVQKWQYKIVKEIS